MVFNGRSLDTFELALSMLNDGIPLHRHLDCISGRSFFLNGENRDTLFSCSLTFEEIVGNLNECLGNVFAIADLGSTDDPFVAEVGSDIGIEAIFRRSYPFGHYVFCHHRENMVYINDPDGFPMLSCPATDFPWKQRVIVRTGEKAVAEREALLRKLKMFVSLHKCVAVTEPPKRIFMQYAVRNYVCQTNKIVECLREYMDVPESAHKEIVGLFEEMLVQDSAHRMNCIDRDIYCLLEELLCAWT